MHVPSSTAALLLALAISPVYAQDLASTCHASSSYDVTLNADSVVFDRATPAPLRVEIQRGSLRTDGIMVQLNAENRDRMTLFERDLRALAPRVRAVAQNGVDMAVQAVRAEAAGMHLSAATRSELEQRLNDHARDLKRRIAASRSTHDWDGDAIGQYANQIAADLMPLIASDMGQQAIDAVLSGDLQAASDLRDQAASLSTQIQPRLLRRMQALRPQIQALCPSIEALSELQEGMRGSNGQPLDLVQTTQ
ncbi:DUF2884 family protein [Rhodanobacter sp. BL-MT-08]